MRVVDGAGEISGGEVGLCWRAGEGKERGGRPCQAGPAGQRDGERVAGERAIAAAGANVRARGGTDPWGWFASERGRARGAAGASGRERLGRAGTWKAGRSRGSGPGKGGHGLRAGEGKEWGGLGRGEREQLGPWGSGLGQLG